MDIILVLQALGEPMRYRIFSFLLERKHCTRSLSRKLGISESAVSQHLKVLKEAGLVYGERYGYHIHYLPRQEAVDFLAKEVLSIKKKSEELDRESSGCQCEFREREENK